MDLGQDFFAKTLLFLEEDFPKFLQKDLGEKVGGFQLRKFSLRMDADGSDREQHIWIPATSSPRTEAGAAYRADECKPAVNGVPNRRGNWGHW